MSRQRPSLPLGRPSRLLLIAAALGACTRATPPHTAAEAPTTSSAAAIARARADSMRLPYSAADIRFMTGMIGHHAQAVLMSRMVPDRTTSTTIRTLAERIINAQQDEIVIMQRWLRDRRQPVPDANAMSHAMPAHDMPAHDMHNMPAGDKPGAAVSLMPGMSMPGMLSAAQLAQLDSARGPEFDELFLVFMIQHHKGAIAMVKDLFNDDRAGQDETVFRFASDVNVDQTTEVARMERMLFVLRLGRKSP